MSQASLFQYYSVCKRKVDEPFKKDKEQQQPQHQTTITVKNSSSSIVSSTIDLQLPQSDLSISGSSTLSSPPSFLSAQKLDSQFTPPTDQNSTETASPFKVPTTPVPRRVCSVNRGRKSGSKSSNGVASSRVAAITTPDRHQESILKWAKRRQPDEMAAASVSPLRLSDRLNELSPRRSVTDSGSTTIDTPKRKKQQPPNEDLIVSGGSISSPSVISKSSSIRSSVRCALTEPMRATKLEQEQQIEALIKCNEKSIENPSKSENEKMELLGSGSNLAALRQRMRNQIQLSSSSIELTIEKTVSTKTTGVLVSPGKDQLVRERKIAFGKCSNLAELREKLAGTDRSFLNKIKEFERSASSPVKLNVNALNPNSPTKRVAELAMSPASARRALVLDPSQSPKKLLEEVYTNSPIKARPDSRASISTDGLNMPLKYKQLIDSFYCLDSVVSMIYNRQEVCTFDKVRTGVQKITKKNFDLRQLAQILFVYPASYECKWERRSAVENAGNVTPAADHPGRIGQFVLVLRPCVPNVKMSPSVLKVRKSQFEEKLLDFSKKEHQKYLLGLVPPIEISPELLRKWHPSFKFPEVPESKLPDPPSTSTSMQTPKSITDFWNQSSLIVSATKPNDKGPEQSLKEANRAKIAKGPLRGLSMGFLEKIKNKEAALLAKEMTRKPEDERKLAMIKQLPPLIRILHSYFVVEKRAAIPIELVIQKCTENSLSLSVGSCNDYITLINELLPDWLFILKVSKGTFIKIDKGKVLEDLFERLDRIVLRLKHN